MPIVSKVELHAHLNGSISPSTLRRLVEKKPHLKVHGLTRVIENGETMTLDEFCALFHHVHKITNTPEDILLITKDVIKDFADDGVKYLELRSTPRASPESGMTARSYVEAVLEGIRQCQHDGLDIDVRYLLSINRSNDPSVAKETVTLAKEFFLSSGDIVLGVDLSGNPSDRDSRDFVDALMEARRSGLKLSIHLSEIPDKQEDDLVLLGIPPDRIGHGTFLLQTAIEICPTSNVKCQSTPSVICTDDKGIFGSSLSQEYRVVAETFGLSRLQVWNYSYEAIDYIFASNNTKTELRNKWNQVKTQVLGH